MSQLNVRQFGNPSGPPLILLHGVTDDGGCWPDAVERWGNQWHILAVDLRGHGHSPRFADEQLRRSPDVLLDDVIGVLREHAPAVVVAHSLGGLLALRAAVPHPGLARALVLEDPANPVSMTEPHAEASASLQAMVLEAATDPQSAMRRTGIEGRWSAAERTAWAESKPLVDIRYLREGFALGDGAWEELFNQTPTPILVVGPLNGSMLPDAELVDNPLIRIEKVPRAGHCVRRDEPEAYHRLVDPFLAQFLSDGAPTPKS